MQQDLAEMNTTAGFRAGQGQSNRSVEWQMAAPAGAFDVQTSIPFPGDRGSRPGTAETGNRGRSGKRTRYEQDTGGMAAALGRHFHWVSRDGKAQTADTYNTRPVTPPRSKLHIASCRPEIPIA